MNTKKDVNEPLFLPYTVPKSLNAFTATKTFIWRTMQNTKNNLFGIIIDALVAPVLMLLIFYYLFGGAIAGSSSEYMQFLLPGILIFTVVPMTAYSGTSICSDIGKGVYNRFRTLPFWQPASILGSLISDGVRYTGAVIASFSTGLLLGFRPEGGVTGTIIAILFVIMFAFSVSWIFTMIGVIAKKPETVSGTSMIFVYPLFFASNVFVDSSTMPNWVQTIVDLNPISIAATVTRGLMSGTAVMEDIVWAIAVCALLILIFAPITIYIYMTKNNR